MKLNKRMKSSLTQAFIINVALLVILGLLIGFKAIPLFTAIEDKKDNLSRVYADLSLTKKEGSNFSDFQSFIKDSDASDYLKTIVQNTKEDFYKRNFINTSQDQDFKAFIDEREKTISEERKSSLLENRDATIAKILPLYNGQDNDSSLSDFGFVNYVESLLYTFNLVSDNNIGVGELEPVETHDEEKYSTSLDSNIFYIPLKLELVGQKTDILDFLYYVQNVGSIDLEGGDIIVYEDDNIKRLLQGEKRTDNYNIYQHQFSDIERLYMSKYIDSSAEPIKGDFVTFIKNTQKREKFSIEIDLRFYVQGLPNYKLESSIKNTMDSYNVLLNESKKSLKVAFSLSSNDSSGVLRAKNDVRSINNILVSMQEDIKKLKISLTKKEKSLVDLYRQSQGYQAKLEVIEGVLKRSLGILEAN